MTSFGECFVIPYQGCAFTVWPPRTSPRSSGLRGSLASKIRASRTPRTAFAQLHERIAKTLDLCKA
jgi:hypothetical protein